MHCRYIIVITDNQVLRKRKKPITYLEILSWLFLKLVADPFMFFMHFILSKNVFDFIYETTCNNNKTSIK